MHRRYGIADFNPRPTRYELKDGRSIVEFPLSVLPIGSYRAPVAGGGYFRLLPVKALVSAVNKLNRAGLPLVTYMHPYEFDDRRLSLFDTGLKYTAKQRARAMIFNTHQNLGRSTMRGKLAKLLRTFEFVPCQEYLRSAELDSGKARVYTQSH
jgi:hypothetical protein